MQKKSNILHVCNQVLRVSFVVIIIIFSFPFFIKKDYAQSSATPSQGESSATSSTTLNILMVGDIMTDRHIRKEINYYKIATGTEVQSASNFVAKYLSNISEVNKNYDYVVANLEGPITGNRSKTLNANGTYNPELTFTLPTSTINILNALNVKVVSLANNHMDNFYYAGYTSTKAFLDKAGIKYFGNPYNTTTSPTLPQGARATQDSISTTVCQDNICVAYVGYHQFTLNNSISIVSDEIKKLIVLKNSTSTDISAIRPDFIIIMPHWGVEYQATATPFQTRAAHAWIDAGADAVIGAHPHVIENSEIYKGKVIYYSLGNYIFDQWRTEAMKTGLALNLQMIKRSTTTIINNVSTTTTERILKVNESGNQKVLINKEGIRYDMKSQ